MFRGLRDFAREEIGLVLQPCQMIFVEDERFAVGIEDTDDLIADLDQALGAIE